MTAMLLLVLSCTTIISIHRKTRKGGRSVSPIGLLFLAGVCLSLSVLCEHHRPTQNQNSNYCAVVKCVTKRTRLIWHQIVTLCLLKTIHGVLFKGLIWIAQMQIKYSLTVSLLVYIVVQNSVYDYLKKIHIGAQNRNKDLCVRGATTWALTKNQLGKTIWWFSWLCSAQQSWHAEVNQN